MARFGRPTTWVTLTDNERETLQRWARRPSSAQVLALRFADRAGLGQEGVLIPRSLLS